MMVPFSEKVKIKSISFKSNPQDGKKKCCSENLCTHTFSQCVTQAKAPQLWWNSSSTSRTSILVTPKMPRFPLFDCLTLTQLFFTCQHSIISLLKSLTWQKSTWKENRFLSNLVLKLGSSQFQFILSNLVFTQSSSRTSPLSRSSSRVTRTEKKWPHCQTCQS